MASVEVIGLLCAGSVKYHRVGLGRRPDLSRSELAGLLAGLTKEQTDLAMAKYGGDESSERNLIAHVRVWLAGMAIREEWRIVRGRPTVCNMAALAVLEVVRPNRCDRCKGRGVLVNRACSVCGASGYHHLSGREIAQGIGVDHANYIRTWCHRYESAYRYVQGIDSQVKMVVRKADRADFEKAV
jgi:hypothetical protein